MSLTGILNGIDVERWNPAADPLIPASFTADDLSGKAAAKRALLEAAGLPVTDASRAASAHRPHLAPDGAEGVRPDRGVSRPS